MYFEEHGSASLPAVILLHGAFFTETFGRQYVLSDKYRMIVPHIPGFGNASGEVFETERVLSELEGFCETYAPSYLVGFSLGAQLAFSLAAKRPDLFKAAVIVSPWLVHKDVIPQDVIDGNLNMLAKLKRPWFSKLVARLNGMPKEKREKFAASMQLVSEETVKHAVDNGISLDSEPAFQNCPVPILALAGEKEPPEIRQSVESMAKLGAACRFEIWEKAAHNIPSAYAKRFNQAMDAFFNAHGR